MTATSSSTYLSKNGVFRSSYLYLPYDCTELKNEIANIICQRLIFTEQQTYFECEAMYCSESLRPQLDLLHLDDKTGFPFGLRAGVFGAADATGVFGLFASQNHDQVDRSEQFFSCVKEYSKRDLTYDSDSVNAFQGVLKYFEKGNSPVYNLMGLPLVNVEQSVEELVSALTWIHDSPDGSRKPSYWEHYYSSKVATAPRRRPQFPSW